MGAKILGLGVGGATLKVVLLEMEPGGGYGLKAAYEDFIYPYSLRRTLRRFTGSVDLVSVAGGGEYVYSDHLDVGESVRSLAEEISGLFSCPAYWTDGRSALVDNGKVSLKPMDVASYGWAASSSLVGKSLRECILLDVGASLTDVIPIAGGRPLIAGMTDSERLMGGELVPTGCIYSAVPSIVSELAVKGRRTRVSSEFFSNAADAHLVLGNIDGRIHRLHLGELDWFSETTDAPNRLAHMVCADGDLLGGEVTGDMAAQIWAAQVSTISTSLKKVYGSFKGEFNGMPPIVVAGHGGVFLGRPAAAKAGFECIGDAADMFGPGVQPFLSAFAAAANAARQLKKL